MSPVRIGWIGCGLHANEMLLPQLVRHDVRLVALCDTDADRLGRTAARYGVTETSRDWREVLARVTLAVANRPGPMPPPDPDVLRQPHRVVPLPMLDVSATEARDDGVTVVRSAIDGHARATVLLSPAYPASPAPQARPSRPCWPRAWPRSTPR